ncbi:hypothetical protein FDECE_6679 [Fusarium decemcellulare]|nr:hypothetical protein FDECE_6679 [Fusarium decemcellulare]
MWFIANIPVVARNHALVICGFLLTTVSASCVILRTISRTVLAYMRWEDWLAILATLGSVGFLTASMFSVSFGLGDVVLPNMLRHFLEARLATIAAYNFTQLAVKFSTLIQYKRIFTLPLAQRVFTYLICWLSIYTLPCLLLPMFPCWPVAKYWDQNLPGQCINQGIPQYTLAGINVFNDLAILIAPWPFLRALRISSRARIALIAVFGCGVFVCLVAVLRLYTIYQFASATDEQKTRHASSGGANSEMTRETEAS